MKPVVSVFQAWGCVVISVFAIAILSVIGGLYKSNHHALLGGNDDPEPGDQAAAVAGTVFSAVIVYAVFLAFCGFQAYLHVRENRRGAISLR